MKKILITIAASALLSACATSGDVARQQEYTERTFAGCKMQAAYSFPDGNVPAGFVGDCMRAKGYDEKKATGRGVSDAPCNWFYCRPELANRNER